MIGVEDAEFGQRLKAFVVIRTGAEVSAGELTAHVKAHLAAFKAPKQVIVVATLGRAANGKLDYRRLKEQATGTGGRREPGSLV